MLIYTRLCINTCQYLKDKFFKSIDNFLYCHNHENNIVHDFLFIIIALKKNLNEITLEQYDVGGIALLIILIDDLCNRMINLSVKTAATVLTVTVLTVNSFIAKNCLHFCNMSGHKRNYDLRQIKKFYTRRSHVEIFK